MRNMSRYSARANGQHNHDAIGVYANCAACGTVPPTLAPEPTTPAVEDGEPDLWCTACGSKDPGHLAEIETEGRCAA